MLAAAHDYAASGSRTTMTDKEMRGLLEWLVS
jgi:hypothetical protein